MNLSEDEIIQKNAINCGHCNRNSLLPYEYEWSFFSCNYVVSKHKN